jgi:uncharacterized repeat protein (TIGR03803 family)
VVYKLDPAGQETVLYAFTGGSDGGGPWSGVIRDAAGNLYGTTESGGLAGAGVVYKVDAAANYTVLYSFVPANGGGPRAGVIRDAAGNLYGTTESGGTANAGVVYEINAAGTFTVLYTFTGGTDGQWPEAGLKRSPGGDLFGTTLSGGSYGQGVVFEIKP